MSSRTLVAVAIALSYLFHEEAYAQSGSAELEPALRRSSESFSRHLLVDGLITGTLAAGSIGVGAYALSRGTTFGTVFGLAFLAEGAFLGLVSSQAFDIRSERQSSLDRWLEKRDPAEGRALLEDIERRSRGLRYLESAVLLVGAGTSVVGRTTSSKAGDYRLGAVLGAAGIVRLLIPTTPERELDRLMSSSAIQAELYPVGSGAALSLVYRY